MKKDYAKAFREVLTILDMTRKEEKNRIPIEVITLLEEKASRDYHPKFNEKEELKELELMSETKAILSLLYREYMCEEEDDEREETNEEPEKIDNKQFEEAEQLWYPVVWKKQPLLKRFFQRVKKLFKKRIFD